MRGSSCSSPPTSVRALGGRGAAGVRAIKGAALTEEERFRAMAVGWCIEWLQAFFLVADDIMDESITRRGQPCWYKV